MKQIGASSIKYNIIYKVVRNGEVCGAIVSESNTYVLYLDSNQIKVLANKNLINIKITRRGSRVMLEYPNVPEIRYDDITIELERLTGELSKRDGNAERARKYITKCNLIGLDVKIEIISDYRIILVDVPDGTGTFEVPDFITGYRLRGNISNATSTVISPFTDTHYSKVILSCRLHSIECLFSGIESDTFELVINNNSTLYNMYSCFHNAALLKELKLSNIKTSRVTSMEAMFSGCRSLQSVNIEVLDTSRVRSTLMMFYDCRSLKYIDISNFDLSNNLNASYMFGGCRDLEEIKIGDKFLCHKLKDTSSMFRGCKSLRELDLSKQRLQNVIYTCGMFDSCSSLESMDLSNSNFDKLEDMHGMFVDCTSIKSINFGENRFVALSQIFDAFKNCIELKDLNLSCMESPDLEDASGMFFWCTSLETVNLHSIYGCALLEADTMFYNCKSLKHLNLGELDLDDNCDTDSMFTDTAIDEIIACDRIIELYNNRQDN